MPYSLFRGGLSVPSRRPGLGTRCSCHCGPIGTGGLSLREEGLAKSSLPPDGIVSPAPAALIYSLAFFEPIIQT